MLTRRILNLYIVATILLGSFVAHGWDGTHDKPDQCDPYNPVCEADDMSCIK